MPHNPSLERLRQFVADYEAARRAHPEWTDRMIARFLGLSPTTVGAYKKGARILLGWNPPVSAHRADDEYENQARYEVLGDFVVFSGLSTVPGGMLRLPKEKVAAIYEMYSSIGGRGLQQVEVARELEISLATLRELLSALGITHRSVAHPPWEIEARDPEELAKDTLATKERLYVAALREKSLAWYRQRYLELVTELEDRERVVSRICHAVSQLPKLEPVPYPHPIQSDSGRWAILVLSDLHGGKWFDAGLTVTGSHYSAEVFRERMKRLGDRVEEYISMIRIPVDGLYLFDLGDTLDNPDSTTFRHQERLQDVYEADAVRLVLYAMRDLLRRLLRLFPRVKVRSVRGNHGAYGRPLSGWYDELLWDPTLKEIFAGEPRLEIVVSRAVSHAVTIGDNLFVLTHGATIGRGVARREVDVMRQVMLHWNGQRWRYVVMGHLHHRAIGGMPYAQEGHVEWILCPSLVGGSDPYAETFGYSGRPAQRLLIVHPARGIEWMMDLFLDTP